MKRAFLPLLLIIPLVTQSQPIGPVYEAGTTCCWYQHNGSAGKMIGVDDAGYAHVVWMRSQISDPLICHVYYNVWEPVTGELMYPGGLQVDASTQAGYACLALYPDGFCFPAYNQMLVPSRVRSVAAFDFVPRLGSFTATHPADLGALEIVWPKISCGDNGMLHMVSTENPEIPDDPIRIYYSRGEPIFDIDGFGENIDWQTFGPGSAEYQLIDTTATMATDIAASPISDRVAIVWTKGRDLTVSPGQMNNDLYMVVSEDGGTNWGIPVNITNFIPPDTACPHGDSLLCNNDTLRVYQDASVIIDDDDEIHVAFTTIHHFECEGMIDMYSSDIWHWSEYSETFSMIARCLSEGAGFELPTGQRMVQRPSLSFDPVTGYLYCSYQQFDGDVYSELGFAMADAYVSVSTNGGLNWAVGTNVTRTIPDVIPAPPGNCEHESDITLADHVVYEEGDGKLCMEYLFAREVGSGDVPTLNPIRMQIIPVDSILPWPLMPDYPFHVEHSDDFFLWFPDTLLICHNPEGCPVSYPVCISSGADAVYIMSLELTISFDFSEGQYPAIQFADSPDIEGHLLENWTVSYEDTMDFTTFTGTAVISASGSTPIGGNGALLELRLLAEDPGCIIWSTDMQFDACLVNGESTDLHTYGGVVTVEGSGSADGGEPGMITKYALHQNYPNPFNAMTNIAFDLPKAERVSLKIFDITGREVTTLADERFSAGSHTLRFDGNGLPSGVYFCRLQAGSFTQNRKLVLIK